MFYRCRRLSRVEFGQFSSLKRIGAESFCESGLNEFHIPLTIEELSDKCLRQRKNVSRVTFGASSLLKRIGVEAFCQSGLEEIRIPNSVEELFEKCYQCESLSCVTFGECASAKRTGVLALCRCDREEIHIPDSVEELCDHCFYGCKNLSQVTLGEVSSLMGLADGALSSCSFREIAVPKSLARNVKLGRRKDRKRRAGEAGVSMRTDQTVFRYKRFKTPAYDEAHSKNVIKYNSRKFIWHKRGLPTILFSKYKDY